MKNYIVIYQDEAMRHTLSLVTEQSASRALDAFLEEHDIEDVPRWIGPEPTETLDSVMDRVERTAAPLYRIAQQ